MAYLAANEREKAKAEFAAYIDTEGPGYKVRPCTDIVEHIRKFIP
jgi:hypothetical protein